MGATEIAFIFLVYLLLFGAKGIPSFAKTMGGAVREFRNATDQIQREILSTTTEVKNEVNNARQSVDVFNTAPTNPPSQREASSNGVAQAASTDHVADDLSKSELQKPGTHPSPEQSA